MIWLDIHCAIVRFAEERGKEKSDWLLTMF
jgi:hypothetical protein